MLLSDVEIGKIVIRDHAEIEEAKGLWERGEWERIGERIVLDPYYPSLLNPMSYPLSVGAEWLSLRNPYTVNQLAPDQTFTIAPHETILILCEEYIALPRAIAGLVVPRARKLFEGSNLSATRIDPTWYGKLIVGFTNASQYTTGLVRGEKFCNLILFRIGAVGQPLSKSSTPHLGRTTIGKVEYPSLRPERLKEPDQISARDIQEMVENFGAPFDIVRGALKETKEEIFRAVEKDLGPRMVDAAVTQAIRHAFKLQQRMLWVLIGLLGGLFGILIGGILTFLLKR